MPEKEYFQNVSWMHINYWFHDFNFFYYQIFIHKLNRKLKLPRTLVAIWALLDIEPAGYIYIHDEAYQPT